MRSILVVFLAVASAFCCQAETEVKLDTPEARAVGIDLNPHQSSEAIEHPLDRVIVFIDAGEIKTTGSDGKSQMVTFQAGDVQWSPAGDPYKIENISDQPVRIVVVELRKTQNAPMPVTKLDAPVVDPVHWKVAFENAEVRVLKAHFGPHETGQMHEHILKRVVVYLSDEGKVKPGDVVLAGAAVHVDKNDGDRPFDRVSIELK